MTKITFKQLGKLTNIVENLIHYNIYACMYVLMYMSVVNHILKNYIQF